MESHNEIKSHPGEMKSRLEEIKVVLTKQNRLGEFSLVLLDLVLLDVKLL